jgi:hypothetical protein
MLDQPQVFKDDRKATWRIKKMEGKRWSSATA